MIKPLADLTLDDLFETAVWRIEDRDGVEIAVPMPAADIPSGADDLLIARSRFRLAGGATFVGYSAPGDWPGVELTLPVIIHDGRHLHLLDEHWALVPDWLTLAPTPDKVFPVTVEPEVRVDGKSLSRHYAADGLDVDAPRPGWLRRWLSKLGKLSDAIGHSDH
jgi:hypothetical protein